MVPINIALTIKNALVVNTDCNLWQSTTHIVQRVCFKHVGGLTSFQIEWVI